MATETGKWEGKTSVELKGVTADQIWPFLADFCNFHKWFTIDTCYHVEGVPGQPGLVRYVSSGTNWAKEKLTAIDPTKKCLSYEILENNMGIGYYKGTFQLLHDGEDGCKMEWSFISDPVQSGELTLETWCSFLDAGLKVMAKRITDAVLGTAESK